MPQLENLLLLIGEALLYFLALSALLRARTRLGAFFCALGVMHFFETYRDGRDYEALFDVADRRLYAKAAIASSAARRACGSFTRARADHRDQRDRGRACPGHGRLA